MRLTTTQTVNRLPPKPGNVWKAMIRYELPYSDRPRGENAGAWA